MARAKMRRQAVHGGDRLARAAKMAVEITRVAGLMKTIEAMPEGTNKRRMMARVDTLIAALQRTPL